MKYIVVIPARYESKRFPGKALVEIAGTSMIERTYRQCIKAVPKENVVIATDDDRIADHCKSFGAEVALTPKTCKTGTDRVASLLDAYDVDTFINVQGDEPLLNPDDLSAVIKEFESNNHDVVNGYCEISDEDDFNSRNIPKVVFGEDGSLLYMSRSPIPSDKSGSFIKAWRQVCIYGFSRKALQEFIAREEKTALEEIEDIEILRFLEMGMRVQMIELSSQSISVDIPEDVSKVEEKLNYE